jgi:hypothetical protein
MVRNRARMTHREAKEVLIRRYRSRGFSVQRIRVLENSYLVIFGQDEKGRGLGPGGLSSTRCNPPTADRGVQLELPVRGKTPKKPIRIMKNRPKER